MSLLFRQRHSNLIASSLVAAIVLTLLLLWPHVGTIFLPKHDTILQLRQLPVGANLHLQAVVTYTDPAGKRFWIQDDTGAMAIEEDPRRYGVQAGQSLILQGTKTQPYNSLTGLTSIDLINVEVAPAKIQFELPPPVAVSLRAFPDGKKTGIQIQLSGIIRRIQRDDLGRVQLVLGDAGQEAAATLPEGKSDMSDWMNAKVHIIGVGESTYTNAGVLREKHIWIQKSDDIRVEESAPRHTPQYTIRGLYRDADARGGHRIRIQGRVAMRPAANSLVLEDR